ncbi:MAG: MFS transporter [Oscillospiraceae bacterium]|mgnify:CR=1 FL=1|nr:MFS transporter [Oscillospiraceae bacterium]
MKLDNKRTILTGLAFLSICAFWQMYNSIVPLILTNTFHLNETYSGIIMAADNILALFLLPLFGSLSDRTNTKIGKRMPYVLFGTGIAIILMNILPIIDNSYSAAPSGFKTASFIVVLGLLLVAMGTYRSPAVALMPDITPKPLRSKANAIINLMGALGGVIYLGVAAVMYPNSKVANLAHVNYQPLFIVVASIMFVAIAVLFLTVKEPKLVAEQRELEEKHPEWNLAEDDGSGNETLPAGVKKSLGFLLASIGLWFIGYNAVETWFTTYVSNVMGQALGGASTCLLIATGGAVVSYIPIGVLASKIGRKRTIMGGIILLASCFGLGYFLTTTYSEINLIMFIVFALVGLAWAAINVNSLPMVVEMCKGSDIGKFTGYYYTFSMAAQVITPVLAGYLMRNVGYTTLFPYAALFVALSFVTMLFVKHGDNKPEAKKGLDAFEDMDD